MFDYRHSVIYQVWPRSFQDSDGDGIGDINGIRSRLDYLQKLGVDAVWVSPVYASPNDDYGYDISDYCSVNPEYGTMEDLQALIDEAKQRNIAIILDFVANHTSTEHRWFKEALKDPSSPYRDFYIFRKGNGDTPPNNWLSFFGDSAWTRAEDDMYYMTLYTGTQADLNWTNPAVREEIIKIMKFYLEMGVAGFRMDTINTIAKPEGLPSKDPEKKGLQFPADLILDRPEVEDYLKEIREKALAPYDAFAMGEGVLVTPESAVRYTHPDHHELDVVYQFDTISLGFGELGKYDPRKLYMHTDRQFKEVTRRWMTAMLEGQGYLGNYLSSHDAQRQLSRFGDTGRYRKQSAKMLAMYNFTLYGTPFIYQGEEIGMINPKLQKKDWKDYEAFHSTKALASILHVPQFIADRIGSKVSRDNGRTPVQWLPVRNAGFTTGTPWMVINPDYMEWNAGSEEKDPDSVLNFYRTMVRVRHEHPALNSISWREIIPSHPHVLAYYRECPQETMLVILNLSARPQEILLTEVPKADHILGNYESRPLGRVMRYQPYEAHLYRIR